jgi:hypothetical protein
VRYTERGFAVYDEFTDIYGSEIRVQKSSLASEDCVWIFCYPPDDKDLNPHLTVEQAERVIAALQRFVQDHKEEDFDNTPDRYNDDGSYGVKGW